jgi:hypothetical protein
VFLKAGEIAGLDDSIVALDPEHLQILAWQQFDQVDVWSW